MLESVCSFVTWIAWNYLKKKGQTADYKMSKFVFWKSLKVSMGFSYKIYNTKVKMLMWGVLKKTWSWFFHWRKSCLLVPNCLDLVNILIVKFFAFLHKRWVVVFLINFEFPRQRWMELCGANYYLYQHSLSLLIIMYTLKVKEIEKICDNSGDEQMANFP